MIVPHLPKPCATGRPREWPMREIINGIFYVTRAGCPWRLLPSDFPPWSTIYRWFAKFRDEGRFQKIDHALIMLDRERISREARRSLTVRASRPPVAAGHSVTIKERRSTDVSATRSWIRTGAASCSKRIRRVSKTAMVAHRF